MTDLGITERSAVLRYASALLDREDRADPVRVGQAALPLLEWAERAPDPEDLSARMRAMSRQNYNRHPSPEAGDPAAFVEAAKAHYDFLTAGTSLVPKGTPGDPGLGARFGAALDTLGRLRGEGGQGS